MKISNLIILIFIGIIVIVWALFITIGRISPKTVALSGDAIVEQLIIDSPVEKIIPVLTATQKTVLSTLVTKSEAPLTSKSKMTYEEALVYIQNLNDQTITRKFNNIKDLKKDIYPQLKAELINNLK